MSKISTETPIKALFCYCLLAFSVTFIATQGRVLSQDKADSKAEAKQETKESSQKSSATASSQKTTESSKKATESSKKATESSKKVVDGSRPVVQVKTEATDGSESHLTFQSDAFDVVVPEWYSTPVSTEKEENVVAFHVIGFDDQQLNTDLEARLQSEIDRYVDQLLGSAAHYYVKFTDLEKSKLLRKKEVRPGIYFDGSKQTPVDFCFAHLEFDKSFQTLATDKWVEKRQQSRLVQFGLIGGASLLLIGFVFGGMRLNTATSGFYQGRLQFFVAIVILGVIAVGVFFGTRIDWI